jgi:hypothetical protein
VSKIIIWSPVIGLSPCGGTKKALRNPQGWSSSVILHDVPEAGFTREAVEGSGLSAGRSLVCRIQFERFHSLEKSLLLDRVPVQSLIVNDRFALPIAKIGNFSEDTACLDC